MCSCVEDVENREKAEIRQSFRFFLYVLKVLNGVALANYNERENCLAQNLHSMTCFGIVHPKSPSLSSENKLSRSIFFFVDKAMKGLLSCSISSVCFNIRTLAFLLPLRSDISDFPQTRQQNISSAFRPKKMNSSLNR